MFQRTLGSIPHTIPSKLEGITFGPTWRLMVTLNTRSTSYQGMLAAGLDLFSVQGALLGVQPFNGIPNDTAMNFDRVLPGAQVFLPAKLIPGGLFW